MKDKKKQSQLRKRWTGVYQKKGPNLQLLICQSSRRWTTVKAIFRVHQLWATTGSPLFLSTSLWSWISKFMLQEKLPQKWLHTNHQRGSEILLATAPSTSLHTALVTKAREVKRRRERPRQTTISKSRVLELSKWSEILLKAS